MFISNFKQSHLFCRKYDTGRIGRCKRPYHNKCMKVHLTLVTWNLNIPLGSLFSSIIISTISIPGLRTRGCPAEKSEFTRYTLVMLTMNPSSNSGASSWRWAGKWGDREGALFFKIYWTCFGYLEWVAVSHFPK